MLYSGLIFSSVFVSTHQSFLFQGSSILSIVISLILFLFSHSFLLLPLLFTFTLISTFLLFPPPPSLSLHFSNLIFFSPLSTFLPLSHPINSSIPSSSRLFLYPSLSYSNLPFPLPLTIFLFFLHPPLSSSLSPSHFHPSISTTPLSQLFFVHSMFILILSSISLWGQLSSCSNSSDSSTFCLSRLYLPSSIHSSLFILISSSRIPIQSSYTSPSLKKILSLSSLSHIYLFPSFPNTLMILFLFSIISFLFPFLHPSLF